MRTRGWATRFQALVQQRLQAPFGWGSNDCTSFACDHVQALHEHDTLAALRVPRATARQALRQMRRLGGADAVTRCGLQPVPPALAGVGDLVLLEQLRPGRRQRAELVLGVCNGSAALLPGRIGLVALPMRQAVAGWRV